MAHSRKQSTEDGSASDEFLINEEFITMLDYYVDKPFNEVQVLQNLLLRAGGNVQGPRLTARPEKLEAGA